MTDLSLLLQGACRGDRDRERDLFEQVHAELRKLAAGVMRGSAPDPVLQPTALVNEAYLKLAGHQTMGWEGRAHFYGAAARAMRQVLVDYARTRRARKREGRHLRVDLDDHAAATTTNPELLIAIDTALDRLREADERCARTVELRFFAGMSVEETAELMGVSEKTVKRDWAFARAWLQGELEGKPQ